MISVVVVDCPGAGSLEGNESSAESVAVDVGIKMSLVRNPDADRVSSNATKPEDGACEV